MAEPPIGDESSRSTGDGSRPAAAGLRVFGDFEIVRELGRGGMGIVYEAQQISLDRPVALKVLHRGLGLAESTITRFQREAHAAGRLHHPNIVPIYDQGEHQGNYYYAMELIEGVSIDRLLSPLRAEGGVREAPDRQPGADGAAADAAAELARSWSASSRPRSWYERVSRMLAEVADALHFAHINGVVHRDIKPHNLIVSKDNRICITDFGLARVSEEPGMTLSGELVGSPLYMSPEQISTGRAGVTPQSDVYSLGATLYQVLTGRPPFLAEGRDQVMARIMSEEPTRPRRVNADIPADLETICLKAMSKEPRERYADAAALADDLRRFANGQRIRAHPAGYARRTKRFIARRRAAVAFTAIAAVLLLVAVSLGWRQRQAHRTLQNEVAQSRKVQQVEALADQAERLFEIGDYEAAVTKGKEALKLVAQVGGAPLEVLVRVSAIVGRAHNALGEHEETIDFLEKVATRSPSVALLVVMAEAYRSRDPARAEMYRERVESLTPDSPDALYLRALAEPDEREQMYLLNRVLEKEPNHVRALERRAIQYFEMGEYEKMKEDTAGLVLLRQKSGYAWALNGVAHLMVGDVSTSEQYFNRAEELDVHDPRVHEIQARGYLRSGRYVEALRQADRAIELDQQRRTPPPEQSLGRVGVTDPGMSRAGTHVGEPFFSLEPPEAALRAQVSPDLYVLRAEVRFYLEAWADCVFDCDQAIELGSADPRVYALRAAARYRMNLVDLALKDIEEAIRLGAADPDVFEFRDLLEHERSQEPG